MIRVVHIVGAMDLGGAETLIMNLYRNFNREEVQFDFLCHNRIEAKYTDEIKSLGGRLYMVEGISHVGLFNYQKNLYKFFKNHPEYQIVHSHQNDLSGIILKQAAKAGVKVRITHSHTEYHHKSLKKKAIFEIFKHYVNKHTTDAFACAKPAGEMLYTGKRLENFKVIHNGIDTEKFAFSSENRKRLREELNLGENPVICHVGRFAKVKNHGFIIDVFNEFLKVYSNAKLMLIGEGELLSEMKEKVKTLGIEDGVLFLGPRTDVNALMSVADIFLFPSIHEGLPVSVVEAQCSGLRILTSDTISKDTVITDLIERMSLSDSAQCWAYKLCNLCENPSANRNHYSKKVAANGFSAKEIADSLVKYYIKSLSGDIKCD